MAVHVPRSYHKLVDRDIILAKAMTWIPLRVTAEAQLWLHSEMWESTRLMVVVHDALAFDCFIGSESFRIVLKGLSNILTSILWHSMLSFPVYLALYAGLDRGQIFYENLWSLGCSYRDL